MGFKNFPYKFGGLPTSRAAVDAMAEKLKRIYSDETTTYSWAELHAIALGIEFCMRAADSVIADAIPGTAGDEMLDRWEDAFDLIRDSTMNATERRRRLAAKARAISNTLADIEEICAKLFGKSFSLIEIDPSAYQYWAGNPHPHAGWDWVSSGCHLGVKINDTNSLANVDYIRLRTDLHRILDDVLPIYTTFCISKGDPFICNIGLVNINPVGI